MTEKKKSRNLLSSHLKKLNDVDGKQKKLATEFRETYMKTPKRKEVQKVSKTELKLPKALTRGIKWI